MIFSLQVAKIKQIDEAGEHHVVEKKQHEETMARLRLEHDELTTTLVTKQQQLADLEKKMRIHAVESQLNDRCQGRKRNCKQNLFAFYTNFEFLKVLMFCFDVHRICFGLIRHQFCV